MAHIQWKDRYNINFREIDAQHHGLLDLLNELNNLLNGPPDPDQVTHIFQSLCDYAFTHFSTEERYMLAAKYPKLAQHRKEHAAFVERVLELSQTFDPADPKVVEKTLDFVKEWYLDHIIKSDQDYAPFLKRALPTAALEGILFGLDGVVCTRDPAPLVNLLSDRSGRTETEVRAALEETPGFLRDLETGHGSAEKVTTEMSSWAGKSIPEEDLARSYAATFRPVPAMLQLAGRLRVHQPVALLGDAAPWLRTRGLAQLGAEGSFTAEVFSCDVGTRLPDKALFIAAAARLGLAPDTCLLIHRDSACLDAAQAAHLQVLHCTTPVLLMAELRRMGLGF